jgi:hypothetical protein
VFSLLDPLFIFALAPHVIFYHVGSADQPQSNHGTTMTTTATTRTQRRAEVVRWKKQLKMLRKTIYYVPVSTTKTATHLKRKLRRRRRRQPRTQRKNKVAPCTLKMLRRTINNNKHQDANY